VDFVRTRTYDKALKRLRKLGAVDADFDRVERAIAGDPRIGDLIAGSGGLRKLRFAFGQVGKSGGGRSIFYVVLDDDVTYLLTAYAKIDKYDVEPSELKLFKALIKELRP